MSESSFLARMARASRERVRNARQRESEVKLLARARALSPAPRLRLSSFDLIAELKLRSPAYGPLAGPHCDRRTQLGAYAAGGASAVSVLTEPTEFDGKLEHLAEAAELLTPLGIPVLRKDFLTEPYQVLEARVAGASGVLIIISMLSDTETRALLDCARACGLFVLLEGFDVEDMERIQMLAASTELPREAPVLAGVNCRDLRTLRVDFARFAELAPSLPANTPVVAESGIQGPEDIRQVARLGYRAALVGSALMAGGDTAQRVAELVAAAREACSAGQ